MPYCSHCGNSVSDSANFCNSCGGKVASTQSVPQQRLTSNRVNGTNGYLELEGEILRIVIRGGPLTPNFRGSNREIHVSDITTIEFKKAGSLSNGYILFSVPRPNGLLENKGLWTTFHVENPIKFNRKQQPAFEELRSKVNALRTASRNGNTQPESSLSNLSQLASLHEQGVITDEEFAAKKAEILNRM